MNISVMRLVCALCSQFDKSVFCVPICTERRESKVTELSGDAAYFPNVPEASFDKDLFSTIRKVH